MILRRHDPDPRLAAASDGRPSSPHRPDSSSTSRPPASIPSRHGRSASSSVKRPSGAFAALLTTHPGDRRHPRWGL